MDCVISLHNETVQLETNAHTRWTKKERGERRERKEEKGKRRELKSQLRRGKTLTHMQSIN